MTARLRKLGIVLAALGLVFVAASGYAFLKTQEGMKSLSAYSAAENVKLNYNDQGQLTDRGTTEGAAAIMSLLKDDWGYPVNQADLNPNDPIVNTATEYMYQMATITHHTLAGTQTVVLDKDVTAADGTVYKAGTYQFEVDGRYFSEFNRANPIEAAAREQAWTGTAHGLIANLGVGTVTASALQLGLGLAGLFAGVGFFALLSGFGLVWATRAETEKATKRVLQPALSPA
jgi:hypothetical protein